MAEIQSKEWRMNHLYKVIDKESKLLTFKENEVQKLIITERQPLSRESIAKDLYLKARQFWVTTLHLIDWFDEVIFKKNFRAEFISIGEEEMMKSFVTVKTAYENLPKSIKEWLWVKEVSKSSLVLGNNSSIRVSMSSRSWTVNYLHVSELGKIAYKFPLKAREIITGSIPAVPKWWRISIESTAEWASWEFYDLYSNWITPENRWNWFKTHFYPWFLDKNYVSDDTWMILTLEEHELISRVKDRYWVELSTKQIAFYRDQKAILGELVVQEYPTFPEEAFLASGRPVFDQQHVKVIGKEKRPETWVEYIISCDPSDMGDDFSIIKVLDKRDWNVSKNVCFKWPIEELALILLNVAREYNEWMIVYENNWVGNALRWYLIDYPNLYTSKRYDKIDNKETDILWFLQTERSKKMIIHELKQALKEEWILLSDPKDCEELKIFQYKSNWKMEAPDWKHDDRVMALAIWFHVLMENPMIPIVKEKKVALGIQRLREYWWHQTLQDDSW